MEDDADLTSHNTAGKKVTKEFSLDTALTDVLKEFLELKIELLVIKIKRIEDKYGMNFAEFRYSYINEKLAKDPSSFEIKVDYEEWKRFIETLDHYKEIKEKYSKKT